MVVDIDLDADADDDDIVAVRRIVLALAKRRAANTEDETNIFVE